jgi:hypothetical protein
VPPGIDGGGEGDLQLAGGGYLLLGSEMCRLGELGMGKQCGCDKNEQEEQLLCHDIFLYSLGAKVILFAVKLHKMYVKCAIIIIILVVLLAYITFFLFLCTELATKNRI